MINVIKKSGLLIPKEYEHRDFYIRIREFLERRTKAYNTSNYVINKFYLESGKFLLVPRNFPIHKFIYTSEIENCQHEGSTIQINHNITPRGAVQQNAIDYMMQNEDGILQLAPGVGKTVISICMIAERKKKSLILVHRDSLADQWRDRFLQFTDLKIDNISRLTSATFETDLEKPIIISTVQTFLSLLKRNRKNFLISLSKANIGIFIADEVHTSVGAPTFSECSIHISARYTYGLSATPYRYDGNEDIIKFHLGEVFEDDDITGTMDARVTTILLDYQIDTPYRHRYIHWDGKFQRGRYLNMIRKSKPFMESIRRLLVRLKDDRQIICMLERINLIDELFDWLKSNSKSRFYKSEKLDTLDAQVTFATPGKCRDGIDAPQKDCVIMTSPISNVEQLTGRINRVSKGKQTPIIIDMIDYGCKRMASTFYKRYSFYSKKGWPVNYLLFVNNKLSKIDEDVAFSILKGE